MTEVQKDQVIARLAAFRERLLADFEAIEAQFGDAAQAVQLRLALQSDSSHPLPDQLKWIVFILVLLWTFDNVAFFLL